MELTTVQGQKLVFDVSDTEVMINQTTKITMGDMEKTNGIVHAIDTVLMPDTTNEDDDNMNNMDDNG